MTTRSKTRIKITSNLAVAALFFCVAGTSRADFDWGGDCDGGSGQFHQAIPFQGNGVVVGTIPTGKRGVVINLAAANDVDVQLATASGHQIIAWPYGDLNGDGEECTTYNNVEYCYSGYNGVGGALGHEFIRINGDTNVALVMKAWGYVAGDAEVTYSFGAVDTCNEKGSGALTQYIARNAVTRVGDIPANKINVKIELRAASNRDVDVQLFDGDVAIVQWPYGLLNGPVAESVDYQGMTIVYSGYNGVAGNWGHETIEIQGRVTRTLTMKAYGYQSGTASVNYRWGIGAGETCGGHTTNPATCDEGFVCKGKQQTYDAPGACHNAFWCKDDADASYDCQGLIHPAVPGRWGCEAFTCKWVAGPVTNTCVAAGYECAPHIQPGHIVHDEYSCGGLMASCVEVGNACLVAGYECAPHIKPGHIVHDEFSCGGLMASCVEVGNACLVAGYECAPHIKQGYIVHDEYSCGGLMASCVEIPEDWCESDETVATDCAHLPNYAPPAYIACVDHVCTMAIHKNGYNEECGGFAGTFCLYGLQCQLENGSTLGVCRPPQGTSWIGGDCNGGFYSKTCVDGLTCVKDPDTYYNIPGLCECPTTVDCEPPYADDSVCNNQDAFKEICPDVTFAL